MQDDVQPQETETQEVEQPGETPQAEVETETEELGAGETSQEGEKSPEPKPERTYTQEEWSKRESAKDQEAAQLRDALARQAMQSEITKAQQVEATAQAKDRQDVEEGTITQDEASRRSQARAVQRQTEMNILRQQQVASQMYQQTEMYGRVLAAQDFGKQYGLNDEQVKEILTDMELRTPDAMRAKAADLAYERERGKSTMPKPVYDSGVLGTSGGTSDLSGLSALDRKNARERGPYSSRKK